MQTSVIMSKTAPLEAKMAMNWSSLRGQTEMVQDESSISLMRVSLAEKGESKTVPVRVLVFLGVIGHIELLATHSKLIESSVTTCLQTNEMKN